MAKKSRGGLVKKQVTVRRKGKTFKQTRMVSAGTFNQASGKKLSTKRYVGSAVVGGLVHTAVHNVASAIGEGVGGVKGFHVGNAIGRTAGLFAGNRTADAIRGNRERTSGQRKLTRAMRGVNSVLTVAGVAGDIGGFLNARH